MLFINDMNRQPQAFYVFCEPALIEENDGDRKVGTIFQGSNQVECHDFGPCPEISRNDMQNVYPVIMLIAHCLNRYAGPFFALSDPG